MGQSNHRQGTGVQPPHVANPASRPADKRAALGAVTTHSQRRTTLEALLDGADELLIEHAGREYRLRITQNGKLILTA